MRALSKRSGSPLLLGMHSDRGTIMEFAVVGSSKAAVVVAGAENGEGYKSIERLQTGLVDDRLPTQ